MPPTQIYKYPQPRPAPPETLPPLEIQTPAGEPYIRPGDAYCAVGPLIARIDEVIAPEQQPPNPEPVAVHLGAIASAQTAEITPEISVEARLQQAQAEVIEEHRQMIVELRELLATKQSTFGEEDTSWVFNHEYSHSTKLIYDFGALVEQGMADTPEGRAHYNALYECFMSALIEMLHTDQEFRDLLEIQREREHIMHNGKMMAYDGVTTMEGITENGHKSALGEAATNPQMIPVAQKCAADVRNMPRIESLNVGEGFVGLSMDLKEAMKVFGPKLYNELGFREGIVFLQGYCRVDAHTVKTFAYSVDKSDKDIWHKVWKQCGGNLPEDWQTFNSLDHPIYMQGSEGDLRDFVNKIKATYYSEIGDPNNRHSVDEFIAVNRRVADDIFKSLYVKLCSSIASGKKDAALQFFIEGLLAASQHLNETIQAHLYDLSPRSTVTHADVALLEQLVRYAAVERLRGGLALFKEKKLPVVEAFVPSGQAPALQQMLWNLAGHVLDGAMHRRTYGGCTRGINMSREGSSEKDSGSDRPDDNGEGEAIAAESASTPSVLKCIKCRKVSSKEKVIKVKNGLGVWECPHCRYWVDVCDPTKRGYRSAEEDTPMTIDKAIAGMTVLYARPHVTKSAAKVKAHKRSDLVLAA